MEIAFNNSNTQKIQYTYTADGIKIRKAVNDNGAITTTDYNGNYVYENNTLKQFYHPEGYVENSNGNFTHVYQYKDIWNNIRLSYSDSNNNGVIETATEILREQNYYPGGLEHRGYNQVIRGVKNNLKQYQDQEFTEDLGLNTHEWKYRVSDPATLRFWQIDPLAEDYTYNSTYAFQENKLGMGVELEGLELGPFPYMNTTDMFNFNTGGKPVLTFGLHNIVLPTVERKTQGGAGAFVDNVIGSIWNGIATTWNEGMNGKNAGEMMNEGVRGMEKMADRIVSGEATIEDAESLVATFVVRKVKGVKNPKKTVVIGEDMQNRVIPYAKDKGFKYFKPRGKNPKNWMKNQKQWINRQLKDSKTEIIDIGPKGKKPTSKYYKAEIKAIDKYKDRNSGN